MQLQLGLGIGFIVFRVARQTVVVGSDRETDAGGRINLPGPQIKRTRDVKRAIAANVARICDEAGHSDISKRKIAYIDEFCVDREAPWSIGRAEEIGLSPQREDAEELGIIRTQRSLEGGAQSDIGRAEIDGVVRIDDPSTRHREVLPRIDHHRTVETNDPAQSGTIRRQAAKTQGIEAAGEKLIRGEISPLFDGITVRREHDLSNASPSVLQVEGNEACPALLDHQIDVQRRGNSIYIGVKETGRNEQAPSECSRAARRAAQGGVDEKLLRAFQRNGSAIAIHPRRHGKPAIQRSKQPAGHRHEWQGR
ncbi:MAG: hypothetical protein WDN28_24700 [Chthoniobacter sp.]